MTPCPICATNDPADGLVICHGCLARIDHDLERIAELTRLAALPLSTAATGGDLGQPDPHRAVTDLDRLDAACGHGILTWLEDWIRLIREEAGLQPYGVATEGQRVTVASSVQWLRSWLLWAAERPDFPLDDLAAEARTKRRSLEHYDPAGEPAPTGTRLACPADHAEADGRRCHGRLVYDRERPRDDLTCPRCGTTWTGARLLLLALHDESQTIWAYPADILAVVDIPAATLRQWVRRGHLDRDGGRYDIGQAWRRRMRVGA
jgi:hypothetical protein